MVYNRTKDNKSGYAGIYFYESRGRYMAYAASKYLGIYATAKLAYAARLDYIELNK